MFLGKIKTITIESLLNSKNYLLRFQRVKQIEDEVLSFQMEGVKTFVVCAGLLYGSGEDVLEKYFQAAWL